MECETLTEAVAAPRPVLPSEPSSGLQTAMVLLIFVWIAIWTAVGFVAGVAWLFFACWDDNCSSIAGASYWFVPLVTFTLSVLMSIAIIVKRAWFYQYPEIVWLSSVITGLLFAGAAVLAI